METNDKTNVEQDLQYIRAAVESRDQRGVMPLEVALIWGGLALIGMPLCDFAPGIAGFFWLIAIPAGFIVQFGWFARKATRLGERNRETLRLQVMWNLGFFAAVGLAFLMRNEMKSANGLPEMILLMCGLHNYLTGLAFKIRLMLWIGLLFVGAYLAMLFVNRYTWTIFGVVFAVVLIGGAFAKRTQHAKES